MKQWVNLHAHSTSSLLDGASKFDEYMARAKELNMPGATFTEHGNIIGLLDAYEAAEAAGIKFAPGQEFYQARKTRFDQDEEERAGKARFEWDQRGPHHLTVIAYNNVGYHNLIKLSSEAYLSGYFVKPRIDFDLLSQYSEGLVILSGCLSGMVQQAILRGDYNAAVETAINFQDIVGKDNFFVEIHNHGIPEELAVHDDLIRLAKTINAPIVATGDTHYTLREDCDHHDNLLCINTSSLKSDENRFKFHNDEFYLKSYDEMTKIFPEEYVGNSMLVYDKFEFKPDPLETHYPKYPLKVEDVSVEDVFKKELMEGASRKYGPDWMNNPKVKERLEYEAKTIKDLGYIDYFLVVSDIVRWAKSEDIPVGPARGSVAGCAIAYCLDIIEVDPLKHNIMFERFLVPGRISPPDIDLDISPRHRDRVVQHTRDKYGHDHTAQIGTMGTIKAKKALRDTARVLEFPYEIGDELAKATPPAKFGVPPTLAECMESEAFRKLYDTKPEAKTIVDAAFKLEGLWRDQGIHAAGLLMTDKPVTEYVPVWQKGVNAPIVTQWDMKRIDKLGLLKMDFLGLRNLDIIDDCIKLVEQTKGIKIEDRWSLVHDPEAQALVFKTLSEGNTQTSFQMESMGITDLTIGIQPDTFDDLPAILALFRPGPMGSNIHREYVDRKHGRKPISYLHPSLEPILNWTYGLMIYQDQILKIATDVAGHSIQEADALRKAIGKKLPEQIKKLRQAFVEGCMKTVDMDYQIANTLFDEIAHHADYGFGWGHGVGYSYISFLTTYLHAKYPAEYMAATLSSVMDDENKIQRYLAECKRLGIKVHIPDIKKSQVEFHPEDDHNIYFGLQGIKGFSDSINILVENRDKSDFNTLFSFLRTVDTSLLDKRTIGHLLNSGALDAVIENIEFEDIEPLNSSQYIEVLIKEFQELTVFISDHPYEKVRASIESSMDYEPIKKVYELGHRERITIAGIIVKIDKRITKKGKPLYDITIQDTTDSVVINILPNIAELLPEKPFELGDFMIAKGSVDIYRPNEEDEDNVKISMRMFEYEIFQSYQQDFIELNTDKSLSVNQMKKLLDIIDHNKGAYSVFLNHIDPETRSKVRIQFNEKAKKESEVIMKKILELA